jgi:hypothetical protein
MESYELIKNHESLLEAFGYWPSFHDAEIHSLILNRKFDNENNCNFASLEFTIH